MTGGSARTSTLPGLVRTFEPAQPSNQKRVATAQARAALVGAVLTPSHDDRGRPTWLLSRWTLTREFYSLDELECVLELMGGCP